MPVLLEWVLKFEEPCEQVLQLIEDLQMNLNEWLIQIEVLQPWKVGFILNVVAIFFAWASLWTRLMVKSIVMDFDIEKCQQIVSLESQVDFIFDAKSKLVGVCTLCWLVLINFKSKEMQVLWKKTNG